MGARQSKRSVDITTTPKKGEGEPVAEGEGKVEKIAEIDNKTASTNGTLHTEIEFADKDESSTKEEDETTAAAAAPATAVTNEESKEAIKENGLAGEAEENEMNTNDVKTTIEAGDQLNDTNASEKSPLENGEKIEETPESKKNKEKSKKKKWSFRSISFSKKDKSKPSKDAEKNGEVKEVAEENAEETATSPTTVEEPPKLDAAESKTSEPVEGALAAVDSSPQIVEEPQPEPLAAAPIATSSPTKAEPAPEQEAAPVSVPEPIKEVRTNAEEIPPPLPSSHPPSPVTVFAESTKADPIDALSETPETTPPPALDELPPADSKMELLLEPNITESRPIEPVAPESRPTLAEPIAEEPKVAVSEPEIGKLEPLADNEIDPADSLPDISTESLPSLPEPLSDSQLPEPMSLPSVDSLPDPIAPSPLTTNTTVTSSSAPLLQTQAEEESLPPAPPSPIPLSFDNEDVKITNEIKEPTILTNGNTNGLASPDVNVDDVIQPAIDGHLKQIVAPEVAELKQEIAASATEAVVAAKTVEE